MFRLEEGSKFDRWEGRVKKIKLSEKCPPNTMNKFSLFASVAEAAKDSFLYTGGAVGLEIDSLRTTNNCFWINFSKDRKNFIV